LVKTGFCFYFFLNRLRSIRFEARFALDVAKTTHFENNDCCLSVEETIVQTKRIAGPFRSKALFTFVGGVVLANPAFTQEQVTEALEEIVVTGLRGSLRQSMEIKHDAIGVVDAISAEDIGKFPDTNLAESLQRITGVSIDRRNGEGALVTARGFGPQFNLVTLNGRQMPGAEGYGDGTVIIGGQAAGSRSFNFAQLAAEAINGIEVYKTGRADVATGGIGATVNIKTARPFDNDGTVVSIGAKALADTTTRVGDDVTPEVSGLFSYANDEKTFGVSLSASYQKRDAGSVQATVNNWNIESWGDAAHNAANGPISEDAVIENAPAQGQLYGIPNDIRYAFSDFERERINAQGAIQFAPADSMTLTLDYTFARNDIAEDRGEQTTWLQRNGFTRVVFDTDEAVATPTFLQEMTGAGKDFGFEQQRNEQRNELNSLGFNAAWDVSERLHVGLDWHTSKAESSPNSDTGGSQTAFSIAGKVPSEGNCATGVCTGFWTQEFQFNDALPIAGRTFYPTNTDALAGTNGNSDFAFDASTLGSQVMRLAFQEQVTELDQLRLDSALEFDEGRLQFGVETREMEMTQRTSTGYMQMGDWGVGDLGAVPDMVGLLTPYSLVGEFNDFGAASAPTSAWRGNANTLGLWALSRGYTNWSEGAAPDGELRYNPGFSNHDIVAEDTTAFYVQFAFSADVGTMPANLVVGARYESTDVTATSHMLPVQYLTWQDDNDFQVTRSGAIADTVTISEQHKYDNILPSLNFDISPMDSLKARFSYGKTIARADYPNLTAAVNPNAASGSTLNGLQAIATANNPGLLPLESTNTDLSLEWYFSENGYVSVGWWDKDIVNFIGNTSVNEPVVGIGGDFIRDQTGGPRAQAALAALQNGGFSTDDSALFTMMAMMVYADEDPFWYDVNSDEVRQANEIFVGGAENYDASNNQHVAFATQYDLIPVEEDPSYVFSVQKPINNKEANIHGWELGGQYFFGDTGFGVLANYTIVEGDVEFEDTAPVGTTQFALVGLSDSANLVLMYENYGFTVRAAYNWREEFLTNANFGNQNNPIYVEEYDQIDLSIGYDLNKQLAISFEAINLTEEDVRWHARSKKQVWRLEDQGARYSLGARYKF
jgi:TonB-dependent receptor